MIFTTFLFISFHPLYNYFPNSLSKNLRIKRGSPWHFCRYLVPVPNGPIYKWIFPDNRSLLLVPNFPNKIDPTQIVKKRFGNSPWRHDNSQVGQTWSWGAVDITRSVTVCWSTRVQCVFNNNNPQLLLNLLAQEIFFLILAHPVYKMWIKQEPNMLELFKKKAFKLDINSVFNLLEPEFFF